MSTVLNPAMLALTREAKGWTQRDLATEAEVSQAVISKIESGVIDVAPERVAHLAMVLDCPPSLLCHPISRVDVANTCLHHRRRHSRLSAAATKRIEAVAHLTRVTVEGIFDGVDVELVTDTNPADFAAYVGRKPEAAGSEPIVSWVDEAARYLRQRWSLTGPIGDLVSLLEAHGVLVAYRSLGSRAQDGVSSWPADLTHPPIIIINSDLAPDRARFTLAHELAHLFLHRVPSDEAEREANRFAGEFLVPSAEIAVDLEGLKTSDLLKLVKLKEQWGVSIGMLIQRARDVDAISDRQFREFRVRLTKLGWDIYEPGTVAAEAPTLLNKAIDLGRRQRGFSTHELAQLALMSDAGFERHYLKSSGDRPPRQVLNLDSGVASAAPATRQSSGTEGS